MLSKTGHFPNNFLALNFEFVNAKNVSTENIRICTVLSTLIKFQLICGNNRPGISVSNAIKKTQPKQSWVLQAIIFFKNLLSDEFFIGICVQQFRCIRTFFQSNFNHPSFSIRILIYRFRAIFKRFIKFFYCTINRHK